MKTLKTSHKKISLAAATAGIVLLSIGSSASKPTTTEQKYDYLIVDTHIDTPYRHYRNPLNIFDGTNTGQFDLPRALQGGLSVVFMSIYTPATAAVEGTSKAIALEQIKWVESMAEESAEIALATCVTDVRNLYAKGKLAFAMGMENGSPLEGSASNLPQFIDRGIRYVTLAHSRSNEFSDSSYDENEQHQGLSEAGRELVVEMNRRGIMIDISHLTDKAAWEVLELTENPVVATHSSLRHFIPGFHRNMSDEMVEALRENRGVVHINFGSSFISNESREWRNQINEILDKAGEDQELTTEQRQKLYDDFAEANPYPFSTVEVVVDHIDRVVDLAGIDYIGIGSDYDGVGDTLPIGLKDVSMFPNLIRALEERGYSEPEIRKIMGENLMRVWEANESLAAAHGFLPQCAQS